jgi:myosin-5
VELTQLVTSLNSDKKALSDRAIQLETQLKSLADKYDKLERKNKNLQVELQQPSASQHTELQDDIGSLTKEHQSKLANYDAQHTTLESTTASLAMEKKKNGELRSALKASSQQPGPGNQAELAELKSQIIGLKSQLAQAMNTPRRQPHHNNTLRDFSPSGGGYRASSLSPNPRKVSASPSKPLDAGAGRRRNSTTTLADVRRRSTNDDLQRTEQLAKKSRPTSLAYFGSLEGNKPDGTGKGSVCDKLTSSLIDTDLLSYRFTMLY